MVSNKDVLDEFLYLKVCIIHLAWVQKTIYIVDLILGSISYTSDTTKIITYYFSAPDFAFPRTQ